MVIIPPGLQLLRQLVIDHAKDRHADGEPQLLPCLHEELEEDIQLLQAGAQRCGGALYFLTRDEVDWEAPSGPINSHRQLLVEGVLSEAGDTLPGVVVVEEVAGRVHARIAGDPIPAEASLIPILRAVAVIASSVYDEFDLIVTATMLAPTDPKRRELLWRLLTLDPVDLGVQGNPTTLVPMLGSNLDPETDYLRVPALRYVVRWDRVVRRSALNQISAVNTIVDLDDRPIVLFLGAGASASSKIPLGNHYRDVALERLVGHHDTPQAAAESFFDLLHERQHFLLGETASRAEFAAELTLERVLLETFNDLGFRPRTHDPVIREIQSDCAQALGYLRPGRKAIRELAAMLRGRLIIMTVNFDQLVEEDLGVENSVFFRPEHYRDRLDDLLAYVSGDATKPVPVLKLHGSIEDPQSLIATIDTTSAGLHDDVLNALNGILSTAGRSLRWVWIGCSMRDRDINLWLGGLGSAALDEWWVDPLPGGSLDAFFVQHRAPKWRMHNRELQDRLIVDSADGFLRALAEKIATT